MTEPDRTDPLVLLSDAVDAAGEGFVELRYHRRRTRQVAVEKGRVDQARTSEHAGVGVRVLERGTWGFASTDRVDERSLATAVAAARAAARASAESRRRRIEALAPADLVRGTHVGEGVAECEARPLSALLELVLAMEAKTRASSPRVETGQCAYTEIFEDKAVVTSDGARAFTRLVRPEFRVAAVARKDADIQSAHRSVGATGGWECLFRNAGAEELVDLASRIAVDRLAAGYPEGGRVPVILSPALVGLLTHEAVGHTVEADFVRAGSCAAGKLGQRVASELVTLCDSGSSEHLPGAGGSIDVDDEGVRAGKSVLIRDGILESYLHNRESAAHYEVAPTGNARAWEYQDEPLIRMRNTYIEPGTSTLEEMIERIDHGYLLEGTANGQADSNGEFMFGTQEAYRIENGKRGPLLRGVNISGRAFEVLSTVDAVASEFRWDLGSGYCGKGQPAKVDAGGPWLSCRVLLGGR